MANQYPSNRSYEPQPGIRRSSQSRSAQGARRAPSSGGRYPSGGSRSTGGRAPSGSYRASGQRPPQGRRPQQPGRRPPQRRRRKAQGRFYGILAALAAIAVLLVLVFVVIKPFGHKDPRVVADNNPGQTAQDAGTTAVDQAFAGVEAPETGKDVSEYASLSDALADADSNVGSLAASDMAQVEDLKINTSLPDTWMNVLLLGTDERTLNESARTDSMMICSINKTTGEVKLASIQRDLAVEFTDIGKYNGTYRINSANFFGGPKLAVRTVNELFGMNIQNCVMVNFFGFQRVAERLGGVEIDITEEEMNQINEWAYDVYTTARYEKIDVSDVTFEVLKTYGPNTHLNGTQALAYARIREMAGGDYMRSERQRTVLSKLMEKVKQKNALEIATLATTLLDQVKTNMELNDIINTAILVAGNGLSGMKTFRLPVPGTYSEERRNDKAMLWDCDFATNAAQLYNFIYET